MRWLLVLVLAVCSQAYGPSKDRPKSIPLPSVRHIPFIKSEVQCFFHFGVNTYTGRDIGNGSEDPEIFQPEHLNTTQWVEACRSIGGKQGILVTKHHDGFFLFPNPYTNHSVASSSWRDHKGDVVADFVQSCRETGLLPAFYLSPWDRNQYNMTWDPKYNEFYANTLEYLGQNYGPFNQLWWDGANYAGVDNDVYDWPNWFTVLERNQPMAVQGGCGGATLFYECGGDTAWVGNENGVAPETLWLAHPGSREITNDTVFGPYFCDVSIRGQWFFHDEEDFLCTTPRCGGVKNITGLVEMYYTTVGRGCVWQLNIPPNQQGLISDVDMAVLAELSVYLSSLYSRDYLVPPQGTPLAPRKKITSSPTAPGFGPENVLVDSERYWQPLEGGGPWQIVFPIYRQDSDPIPNTVMLQEHLELGQRVAEFVVDALTADLESTMIASGTTIGIKRLLRVDPAVMATAKYLRITFLDTILASTPVIDRISLLHAPKTY